VMVLVLVLVLVLVCLVVFLYNAMVMGLYTNMHMMLSDSGTRISNDLFFDKNYL